MTNEFANPNGPWTLGYNTLGTGYAFAIYSQKGYVGSSDSIEYVNSNAGLSNSYPSIWSMKAAGSRFGVVTGEVSFHPGPVYTSTVSGASVARFTCPSSGFYNLLLRFGTGGSGTITALCPFREIRQKEQIKNKNLIPMVFQCVFFLFLF